MITTKEIKQIDTGYFEVLQASAYAVYLRSKNTKHFWGIVVEEFPSFRHFQLFHKHNPSDQYHRHKDRPTLKVAIEEIQSHDRYQLNGRKMKNN